MGRRNFGAMKSFMILALPLFFLVTSCAEVQLKAIPAPSPDAKLRIFVQPTSDPGPRKGWGIPHGEFEKNIYRSAQRVLAKKGIYEVVPREEVRSVLGRQISTAWRWERDDWALTKKVGKALYAEYAMIFERGWWPLPYWRAVLINVDTGKQFAVFSEVEKHRGAFSRVIKASYRELFRDAKKDLMATAIRKGRRAQASQLGHRPPPPREVPSPVPPVKKTPALPAPKAPSSVSPAPAPKMSSKEHKTLSSLGRKVDIDKALEAEFGAKVRTRLAVYDLDAAKNLKIVALILSDALREELFQSGSFILVNRENVSKMVQELMLGQTGLIDEKQAVKAGKALAASQIIVGRLASIGKNSLLQAKRIDTETHGTLALGSLKCKQGEEEVLLVGMEELARKLVQAP